MLETAFHLKERFPSAAISCLRCFLSENPLSSAAAVFHVVAVPHFWVLSDNVESRSRKTSWSFAVSTSFRTMFHVLFHRSVCNWSAVPSAAGTWFVDKMCKDDLLVGT